MIRNFVFFAAILFVSRSSLAQPAIPATLSSSLMDLEGRLQDTETLLKTIDVAALDVPYRYGKYVEGSRTRSINYIKVLRRMINAFRRDGAVRQSIFLASTLPRLEGELEMLIVQFAAIESDLGDTQKLSLKWANAVDEEIGALSKVSLSTQDEIERYAEAVDYRLRICRASQ